MAIGNCENACMPTRQTVPSPILMFNVHPMDPRIQEYVRHLRATIVPLKNTHVMRASLRHWVNAMQMRPTLTVGQAATGTALFRERRSGDVSEAFCTL